MEGKYANIIVDISHEKLDRTFQYIIPEELIGKLKIGSVVRLPFGRGDRVIRGYVMEITDKPEYDETKMKPVLDEVTGGTPAESKLIRLAFWMKENYGSTMAAALKTVLPVKKKIRQREKRLVCLRLDPEEAQEKLCLYRKKNQTARARLLEALTEQSPVPYELLTVKLNISPSVVRALSEQGVLEVSSEKLYRNPVSGMEGRRDQKKLTEAQNRIVLSVMEDFKRGVGRTYLLHGITGSGKTEVYMELIAGMRALGRQAIVLIPEIALTYQTVLRFYGRFGDRVSIVNSRLSDGERYDQFERARNGEIDVMIGPRSALFTPFSNLGIIIIDEEHEGTYKSETVPKYHARETAVRLAAMSGACVLLGSATPSLEAYYKAVSGEYGLFELNERVTKEQLPAVYTADLREELKAGNRSVFSRLLAELMEDRLRKGEQIMLFLNRRGYAGFISCRSCGHVMKCPHCDVSLSAHRNGKLVCHYCGYETPVTAVCPECGSKFIGGMKLGTEKVEELLRARYPSARVLRMDMDTTRGKDGYEKILSAFANREADILVGTQMIVKGHDFPYVTLVGILAADMSLNAGDYRAAERTFQLLTQAAGRAGRGEHKGEVVIQTYNPEHYSIRAAAKQDYRSFYEQEIGYRELLGYPPAAHMMAVLVESPDVKTAEEAAAELSAAARQRPEAFPGVMDRKSGVAVIGPADAGIAKINDIYRKVLYVKSEDYGALTAVKDCLERIIEEKNRPALRIQFDFDPMSAY